MKAPDVIKALVDPIDAIGQIVEKLATGKQVFMNMNYGAQRTRKAAFAQQANLNVEYTESLDSAVPGVEFVKKNYKGNFEALNRHRFVENCNDWNMLVDFDSQVRPEDDILGPMVVPRLAGEMKFLRLQRIGGVRFQLGHAYKLETEFFPLQGGEDNSSNGTSTIQTNEDKGGVLCMKYGNGVLIFDEAVGQLNLKEVRNQVRNKMQAEQNGLGKETVKEVQELLTECWTFSKFSK